MIDYETITYSFPGGMNADSSGIADKIFIGINQKVHKGDKLALFSSGNYEMEITAEENGIVTEIMIKENQKVNQNDKLWKIKTCYNNVYN